MQSKKFPSLTLHTALVQDDIPVLVLDRLYFGSIHAAFNLEALKSKQVTHIVNASGSQAVYPAEFSYLTLYLRDKNGANLLSCLPTALYYMQQALADSHATVFVHCTGGRSRSPALLLAFLMTNYNLTYEQGMHILMQQRSVVAINSGFQYQLRCYQACEFDVHLANQLMLHTRLEVLSGLRGEVDDAEGNRHKHNNTQRKLDSAGRFDGRVSTLYELSTPQKESEYIKQKILANPSMTTVFCCKNCESSLFSSSCIVFAEKKFLQPKNLTAEYVEAQKSWISMESSDLRDFGFSENPRDRNALTSLRPHTPLILASNQANGCPANTNKLSDACTADNLDLKTTASAKLTTGKSAIWKRVKRIMSLSTPAARRNRTEILSRNNRQAFNHCNETVEFLQSSLVLWKEGLSYMDFESKQRDLCAGASAATCILNTETHSKARLLEKLCSTSQVQIGPLPWVLTQIDSNASGSISCPCCAVRLGNWQWKDQNRRCGGLEEVEASITLPRFELDAEMLRCHRATSQQILTDKKIGHY